jgi:hypothetical protein
MSTPYKLTLQDLRLQCPLLHSIEVIGHGPEYGCSHSTPGTEALIGKNAGGEIVVRVKGKVTPSKIRDFRDAYQMAVARGIIKPSIPTEQEPT